ncbi:hypothetical protein HMPREF0083_00948 [Aneurinibacillus aneurinilyticus ATCC 12856]|uniref:Uncharacterized protein n=1 Tax=Aneurinibacillus aneurinilyticus ATCC 12856 TaxID=649747 RepID=U1X8S0_ANEAE|nr:hypothetical protein HMPREF0083_00948 [Aneurinibacillus aneurinilyticus ATCC 12856]
MVGSRKFGKKKRLDAPCAPAEERPAVFFYLLPQKFVDLSNQMYIALLMLSYFYKTQSSLLGFCKLLCV